MCIDLNEFRLKYGQNGEEIETLLRSAAAACPNNSETRLLRTKLGVLAADIEAVCKFCK